MLKLALSLFLSLAQAQDDGLRPASFRDFSGGYVDAIEGSMLQPNQSPDSLNVVVDDPVGAIHPRNGFTQCGVTPSGNEATALYEYYKSDGTRRLIVTDNTTVWETRDCRTFTSIKNSGLNANFTPSFATVRNKLWVVNGSTHPFTWDGSTTTLLSGATSATPNPAPPLCRYIEFWKERVWCARTVADPSSVAFSALEDNNGNDIDPSTGSASWPATNAFYVDQDGGSPIYGIKAYRDRLYVFKDNGIWQIVFNSDFDNAIVKTLSSVGTRFNTSIVELDNLLYFVGPDGIYAFDGNESVRISDPIVNKFKTLNQPLVNNQFKTWTTQSDFAAGTVSSASVTATDGSVVISSFPAHVENGRFENASLSPWLCSVSGDGVCELTTHDVIEGSRMVIATVTATGANTTLYIFDTSGSTLTSTNVADIGGTSTRTVSTSDYRGRQAYIHFETKSSADHASLYSPLITLGDQITFQADVVTTGSGQLGFRRLDNVQTQTFFASATWTSEIYDTVSVSTWSTLDASYVSYGGNLTFQVRSGTNTGGVQTSGWTDITPGSIISFSTGNTLIQARVILSTTPSSTQSPRLDDLTINYAQGGVASNAIYAQRWDNRLWIAASSGTTTTTNNVVFVKTRLPLNAWMIHDFKIGPMVKFNDRFYAAASTHSAIYRMDYGSNDNGASINWYWTSRDETWGTPNNVKYLLEMTLDFKKGTATNLQVGYSSDYGTTFTNKTVNASGTGRGTSRLFVNGNYNRDYRFRIGSSTADETATITGMTGWARTLESLRE